MCPTAPALCGVYLRPVPVFRQSTSSAIPSGLSSRTAEAHRFDQTLHVATACEPSTPEKE